MYAHGTPAGKATQDIQAQTRADLSQATGPVEASEPTVHHNRKVHHAASGGGPWAAEQTTDPGPMRPIALRRGGRVPIPPAMKGSHEILVHQNQMADAEGLARIQDDADLLRMRSRRELVPLPASASLVVDERLPSDRRFTRPWVAQFLTALAHAHTARFGNALQVNSAVRTVAFQVRLMRTNGNAAPAEGDAASPHLTGQAVDIAKHGLSAAEIGWMRAYLIPLADAGKIDVEEEFQQACFHISVYQTYGSPGAQPKPTPAARVPVVLATVAPIP